jgi:hypothetical protein
MTGIELNDMIIRVLANSGVSTDELNGLQEGFINEIRDASRGEVLNFLFLNFRSVAPIFFQEMYVTEEDYTQEGDCVIKIPAPVPLYKPDGLPWVEWAGGSDWNTNAFFRVVKNRREVIGANAHHIVGRKSLSRAFYDTNSNVWWMYWNNEVREFSIRQINAHPYQSKEFNIETDEYPFPTDQVDRLMDVIIKRYFRYLQGQQDLTPNSIDDRQLNAPRR